MSEQDPDHPILSYRGPEPQRGWWENLDAPAILDLGAATSLLLLIAAVSSQAGCSNTLWWTADWESFALFCFYRVLESLIFGLPLSALIVRILRYFTGRGGSTSPKWIGLAVVAAFFVWCTTCIDLLMHHI